MMIEDSKARQLGRYVFSDRKLTIGDAAMAALGGVLLFTGHWIVFVPVVVVGTLVSRAADSYFWS